MKQELLATSERIKEYVHCTPVLTSQTINRFSGAEVFFKCENFQKMGAFKMRGAINAMLMLTEEERQRGVVTHSSGNFAQAVSLSAQLLGVKASIVMPSSAPKVKQEAVAGYGGRITISEPTLVARQEAADKIIEETGATFLHPSNDMNVILGNSTAAQELLQEVDQLDILMSPIGGGGLIAGTALAANFLLDNCMTIGGEPMLVDDAYRSLISGKIEGNSRIDTVADGLRTTLGDVNFPIIQKYVKEIIRVEEDEIIRAMRMIWERMKIIIEPSCAVPFAAVLKAPEKFAGKRVGIIISGGNVDLKNLPF